MANDVRGSGPDWKKVALVASLGGVAVRVIKPRKAKQWAAVFIVLGAVAALGQLGVFEPSSA